MSTLRVVKIATNQVADIGVEAPVGIVINVASETEEFEMLGSANLDTSTMSESDVAIVNDFLALVNAALIAS